MVTLPRFMHGTALSFIVTGCAAQQAAPTTAPVRPAPEQQAAPPVDRFSRAFHVYKMLLASGVKPNDLDVGCHFIDYTKPGPNEEIKFKGNKQVDECEVLEYALDHDHADYPDKKKHPEIARAVSDGPIPWILDDMDPTTTFDAEIRARVDEAIKFLKLQPALKKLESQPELYRERLGTALFYFTMLPTNAQLEGVDRHAANRDIEKVTIELETIKLASFRSWLIKNGGLGTIMMKFDMGEVLSAVQSIDQKKRSWTAPAKILFAVFEYAGLSPVFVYSPWRYVRAAVHSKITALPGGTMVGGGRQGVISVALPIGKKRRAYDPAFFSSKLELETYYPLRLLHFLAVDKATEIFADPTNSLSVSESLKWDPNTPLIPLFNGALAYEAKNYGLALQFQRDAIRKDPHAASYYLNMGDTLFILGDFENALKAFHRAVELDPEDGETYFMLASAYNTLGSYDKAVTHYHNAIERDMIDPRFPLQLINLLLKLDRVSEVDDVINDAYRHFSTRTEFIGGLGEVLMEAKRYDQAENVLNEAIARQVHSRDIYRMLIEILLIKGRIQEANTQLNEMLSFYPASTEHEYSYAIEKALSHSSEEKILKDYAWFLINEKEDYANAARILTAGRKRHVDDFDIYLMLATAYDRADDVDALRDVLRDILTRFSEHPDIGKAREKLNRLE